MCVCVRGALFCAYAGRHVSMCVRCCASFCDGNEKDEQTSSAISLPPVLSATNTQIRNERSN